MGMWNYAILVNKGKDVDFKELETHVFKVVESCHSPPNTFGMGCCIELKSLDNTNGLYLLEGKALDPHIFVEAWEQSSKHLSFDVYTCSEGSEGDGWKPRLHGQEGHLQLTPKDCSRLLTEMDEMWTAMQKGERHPPRVNDIYNRLMMHAEKKS